MRLRGAVKRDYRTRELEDIYGAEGTARFGKALERVLSGLDCLGVKRSKARKVVRTIAFDSVPPNRLRVYRPPEDAERPGWSTPRPSPRPSSCRRLPPTARWRNWWSTAWLSESRKDKAGRPVASSLTAAEDRRTR